MLHDQNLTPVRFGFDLRSYKCIIGYEALHAKPQGSKK
jgi:hypothetical protein